MEAKPPPKQDTFLTDQEYRVLFPDKEENNEFGEASKEVCEACSGACCQIINCIFYSPRFRCCPIYEYRPQGCRDWFCARVRGQGSCFTGEEIAELKEIAEPEWVPLEIRGGVVGVMEALNRWELSSSVAEVSLKELVQLYRQQGS